MSGKQHIKENQSNQRLVQKPEVVPESIWNEEQTGIQQATPSAGQLPSHTTNLTQRRRAILQLQRSRGNNFVMRQVMPSAMRQEESPAEAATPSEISSDGNRVSTSGGVTIDSAGVVSINAAMTRANGILQADTIIADNVIAASYSPGAGNIM